MRILVGIWHPAHVHFYKNFIWEMEKRGHKVFVLARAKEITYYLLDKYEISYQEVSVHRNSMIGKAYDFFHRWKKTYEFCKEIQPDIATGIADFYFAQISKLLNFKSVVFTDSEHVKIDKYLTFPFATRVIVPNCFTKELREKQIRYNGYHELAYLHPDYFKPEPSVLNMIDVEKDEKYVIMRFVSWAAVHDIGHSGLDFRFKRKLVETLSRYAKVFITSEGPMPKEFKKYRIKIPPEKMHDALYYASLYIGEGATMASECAVLGTPAIYVNTLTAGTLEEQEKRYGLIIQCKDNSRVGDIAINLLRNNNLRKEWDEKRKRMLLEKNNTTKYMCSIVENNYNFLLESNE